MLFRSSRNAAACCGEPSRTSTLTSATISPLLEPTAACVQRFDKEARPIGALDILIAAHAIALDLPLTMNNTWEFRRVPGLRVENWLA